jgi:hypothetical protein
VQAHQQNGGWHHITDDEPFFLSATRTVAYDNTFVQPLKSFFNFSDSAQKANEKREVCMHSIFILPNGTKSKIVTPRMPEDISQRLNPRCAMQVYHLRVSMMLEPPKPRQGKYEKKRRKKKSEGGEAEEGDI